MQATIEKASIDEVYIDATAMVDKELQVLVPLTCCTLLPRLQELTVIHDPCREFDVAVARSRSASTWQELMQTVLQAR